MFDKLILLMRSLKRQKPIQQNKIVELSIDQLKENATLLHPVGFYVLAIR